MSVLRNKDPAAQTAPSSAPDPQIAILMGLHNGQRWLDDQLESLRCQTHTNWSLLVSDDGSADQGPALVERFAQSCPVEGVAIHPGPCRGFARNYLSMLALVDPSVDTIAFCDQDDVWLPDRLARAARALRHVPDDIPALYVCATWITPSDLSSRRRSRPMPTQPSFANALVQCIGGGNTMALNRAGLTLLRAAAPEAILATGGAGPASHDWWAYQMIAGAGGRIIADPDPCLLYRQHGGNLSGANRGWRATAQRANQVLRGQARALGDRNVAALNASAHRLTPEHRQLLARYGAAGSLEPLGRVWHMSRLGLRRTSRVETMALRLGALFALI